MLHVRLHVCFMYATDMLHVRLPSIHYQRHSWAAVTYVLQPHLPIPRHGQFGQHPPFLQDPPLCPGIGLPFGGDLLFPQTIDIIRDLLCPKLCPPDDQALTITKQACAPRPLSYYPTYPSPVSLGEIGKLTPLLDDLLASASKQLINTSRSMLVWSSHEAFRS